MIVTYNNINDCKKRLQNLKKFKLNNQYNSLLLQKLELIKNEQKKIFEKACNQFLTKNKVDAVMLGETDLALIYRSDNVDFKSIDCAKIHVEELFRLHVN